MTENTNKQLKQLEEQISKLTDDEKYQEALDVAKNARNIALDRFGEEHPTFAIQLTKIAVLYYLLEDPEKAEHLFLRALKIMEKSLDEKNKNILITYRNLGILNKSLGNYEKAAVYFERCLRINPGDDQTLKDLVTIYQNLKQYKKAEDIVKQVIESEGENSSRLNLLYCQYVKLKKYEEWESSLLKSLEKDPTNLLFYENLSFVYSMLKDYEKQESILLEAINRNLTSFDIYRDLGELYINQKKTNDAYQALSKARDIIPSNDSYAWSLLGENYIQLKKFEEAIELLEQGNEKFESYYDIKEQLILAYLYKGDCKNAEAILPSLIDHSDSTNKTSAYDLPECLLKFGAVASNSCIEALTFLEEAYFNLPDVDDTKWVFSASSVNLMPEWLKKSFSVVNSLEELTILKRIVNIIEMPLVFLFGVFILFPFALSLHSEFKYFVIFGTLCGITWSFFISLAIASFITGIMTGGVEKAKAFKLSQKLRRVIGYVISYFLLRWLGGEFKHSTDELYQLTGKVMHFTAYIYPIFSLVTDINFYAWIFKDENEPQTQQREIRQAILTDKVIRYGGMIFLMIFLGGLTAVKAIASNFLSDLYSLPMAVVQIIQGTTMPISIYISLRIYHAWRVTKSSRYRFNEIFNSLCYATIITLVSSYIYLSINKEAVAFTPIFLMLFISLIATIFGGMLIGGIYVTIANRPNSNILLRFILILTAPFTVSLFIVLPASIILSAFIPKLSNNLSFIMYKELFVLQIIIGGWLMTWSFISFLELIMRPQHQRKKMVLVRHSDPRLKPAYEIAEKILNDIDHKPTLKEHYIALQMAVQLYYPGDCLFLPPIFSSFLLTPADNFRLTVKDISEKGPYSWILQCLYIQKSNAIEERPSLLKKMAMQVTDDNALYNRDELVEKMKLHRFPHADTIAFQTIYENGDYLLREGRVVEAAELAVSAMENTISQETKVEFMLNSYRFARIAGREDISAKILDEFRKRSLINQAKYSTNDRWVKFLTGITLWFSPFQQMHQPAKFTESILCALEANFFIKSSKRTRLRKESVKSQNALNNARNKLDHAWQIITTKFDRVALANLWHSELSYSLEKMEHADYNNVNNIKFLQKGLSYWYLYVLTGPVSDILLSQRSDALELRIKNIKLSNSKSPNENPQRELTGECLLEWIEQEKWDQVLMKNFPLEDAEFEGWQQSTTGLLPYPMNISSCIASHLIDLARLLHKSGKDKIALTVLNYTSSINKDGLDPSLRRDLSALKGKINLSLEKSNDALSNLKDALDASTLVARDLRSEEQIIDFNAENATIYNQLIEEYFRRKEFEECLTLLERGRSESLSIMMHHKINEFEAKVLNKDEDWTKLEALRSKIFEIQSRCGVVREQRQRDMLFVQEDPEEDSKIPNKIASHSEKSMNKLKQELEVLEREYRLIMEKLMDKKSTDMDYLQPPSDFRKLRQDLADDEAFLIFHESENSSFCFWATNKEVFGHEISEKIKFLATDLANKIRTPQTPIETIETMVNELSRLSLLPLLNMVSKYSKRRVYYVPMGVWSELPLVLLKDQNIELQHEEWRIATLPSASIHHYLPPVGPISETSALGIGNPYLGSPEFDLPFAGQEVETLRKQFPDSQILCEQHATIDGFLNGLHKRPRIIHLACHGEFKPEQPMLSALRLAPSDKDDGVLHGYRIRYHGLGGDVDLCVLSACWSGRASIAGFNEQIGLSRTLLGAGASSLITSLWAIDDQSTAIFFEKFYGFAKDYRPSEGLEMARDYLRTTKGYTHPYYWAPFIWTGGL